MKTSFKWHHPGVIFNPTVLCPSFSICSFSQSSRSSPSFSFTFSHGLLLLTQHLTAMINGSSTSLQLFQSTVPKVEPTLRWSMSWISSSTCPWLHSSGGFLPIVKKLGWPKWLGWISKILEKKMDLLIPLFHLNFQIFQFRVHKKLPLFHSQLLQHSFSIPFLEALPAAVWNALDPWRRFPRRASRNFAAVTSKLKWLATWPQQSAATTRGLFGDLEKHTPQNVFWKKTETLQTSPKVSWESTSSFFIYAPLKQTASLGDIHAFWGKPICRGYVRFSEGVLYNTIFQHIILKKKTRKQHRTINHQPSTLLTWLPSDAKGNEFFRQLQGTLSF